MAPILVSSQERGKMDSMLTLMSKHRAQDTTRVNLAFDVFWIMLDFNPDSSRLLCQEAMNLSRILHYNKGICRGYLSEGMIARILDQNLEKAKVKCDSALLYAHKMAHPKFLSACHNNLGQIYSDKGQYAKAIQQYELAVSYAQKVNNSFLEAKTLSNIALIYYNSGNFNLSLQFYIHAAQVAERIKDLGQQVFCENNIAGCLTNLKRFPEAEQHLQKSLSILDKIHNPILEAQAQNTFGTCFFMQGQYEKALSFHQIAFTTFQQLGNFQQLDALDGIAQTEKMLGRYSEAERHFKQLLEKAQDEKTIPSIAWYHHELGELYEKMGRTALSLKHFHKGVAIAEKVTNNLQLRADYASLGKIYSRQGDYKRASSFWEKANAYSDTVYNAEITNKIQQQLLEDNFRQQSLSDSLTNVREQTTLNQKLSAQRNATLAGWSFGGIAVVLTFLLWNRFRLRKRVAELEHVQEVDRVRAQKAESEMTALRAQMNPHFIFNSLNSINAYILRNEGKTASGYLTEFAQLMRQMLDNSAQETISLENAIEFLQSYLRAEAMRMENKLTWDIRVSEEVDTFETVIPSMILQPYIENAVWHGIAHKPEGGKITVSIKREASGALLFLIEDNGVGRAFTRELRNANGRTHESKGLKITEERLVLYDQKHGTQSSVNTTDLLEHEGNGGGTKVEIRIS